MSDHLMSWIRHRRTGEVGRVVEDRNLWGASVLRIWLPARDAVMHVAAGEVEPVDAGTGVEEGWRLIAAAAAARIEEALAQEDVLVAPLEGLVTPLPHQLHALARALSGDRIRYLLADEVGLGKTIEAGLVFRELKVRGLVRRVLVVAPMGLCSQWVQEMKTHFQEDFTLVVPARLAALRQLGAATEDENLWRRFDQVVCPVDGLKPLERRRGWSRERVDRHNRERFEDLVTAGWDLVVVDEAHRLAGSTSEVARYKLGEALSQAAPYVLLLSATPHQGKTDAFRRLMGFLDPDLFVDDGAVTRERVAPYVVRTEKRLAIDAEGRPLFRPRRTELRPVAWEERTDQHALYEEVTAYVREGYDRARREKRQATGFLMSLFQRLVTSSTRAVRAALERRLEVLAGRPQQLELPGADAPFELSELEDDPEGAFDVWMHESRHGLANERDEVERLVSLARRCEASGPDVKARALLALVQALEREENDPELKVLVFTEFVPTQEMLATFLEERGYRVAFIHGSLDMGERLVAQEAFRSEARVLVSTDAGGEGLNLQFAHVVVNYDLPWNPMKVEQRIGRVDRIGQTKAVRAFNFALEDTVELRVREVLEEKLALILEEFGVDKLSDVLDSDAVDLDFEGLYAGAVSSPEEAEARAAAFAELLRQKASEARAGSGLLGESARPDSGAARRVEEHQLPFWTERLTIAWLRAFAHAGAEARRHGTHWSLRWPDGHSIPRATFDRRLAGAGEATLLTIEDPLLREARGGLPRFAPGQPIPSIELPGLSDKVKGVWSLWRISLQSDDGPEHRYVPLFLTDDGRMLGPTARAVWDRLVAADLDLAPLRAGVSGGDDSAAAFEAVRREAERHGQPIFEALLDGRRKRLARERARGEQAFEARRRVLDRLGLSSVRSFRIRQLEEERRAWTARQAARAEALPDLAAVLMVRVEPGRGLDR